MTHAEKTAMEKAAADAVAEVLGIAERANTLAESQAILDKLYPRRPETDRELAELRRLRRTPPFFPSAYRIQRTSQRTKHTMGGRGQSPAPRCAICRTALLRFANFDATDQRLRVSGLRKIPLYYCFSCPGPVHYHFTASGRIKVLSSKQEDYDESPVGRPLERILAGNLKLIAIDDPLDQTIESAFADGRFQELTSADLKRITALLGRKPRGRWDLYFSQVGGYPRSYQGEEGVPDVCPNVACPFRLRESRECKFRPLAVLDLWNDRFWLRKSKEAVQIVFSICPGCFTIAAKYTCT